MWPHCPDCGQKIASQDFASHQKTQCPSRNAQHSSTRVQMSPPPSQIAAVARRTSLNSPRVPTKENLPLILYARRLSKCHGARCLIVRSREGGFVSRDCIECGEAEYIRLKDFPEVNCSRCKVRFEVSLADKMNYFFVCSSCGKQMKIADIVPPWSDRFQYHGLAAYGDKRFCNLD